MNATATRKFTLLHKGLLIVGIPFLCQLFIIGLLLHEMEKSEAEAATEAQAKEIVDQTQRVTEACYGVVFAAWNCRYTSATTTQNLIDALGSLPPARDNLRKTLKAQASGGGGTGGRGANAAGPANAIDSTDYEQFSDTLDKLSQEFGQWRDVITTAKVADKSKLLDAFDDKAVRNGLTSQLERVAHGLNEINRKSDTIRATSPERQVMVQNEMQMIGIAGGIATGLLGLVLALFFSKNITNRVQVMEENSRRLVDGQPLHPALTGNDEISEVDAVFHRMAKTLEEARAKEAALINNTHEVICSLDAEGNFVRLNPACLTRWGYTAQELTGRSVRAVIDDAYASATIRTLSATRTAQPFSSLESTLVRKDQTLVNVVWSVCWSEVEQLLFCVVHDITERKQVERLKQDFFAMVSHDLKAPLASVMVAHEMVMQGIYGDLSNSAEDKLEVANRNLSRLVKLVNDLLDLEKLEAGQMPISHAPNSVAHLVDQSIDVVEHLAAQQGVIISMDVADSTFDADGDRFEQALVNLLSHAIRTSSPRSVIAISVENEGSFTHFVVQDQAEVVPEDQRRIIFERFNPLNPSTSARGDSTLGLAICKLIVESHGGTVSVAPSPDNKGNQYRIIVPTHAAVSSMPMTLVAKSR